MTVVQWGRFYGYSYNEFGSLSKVPYWNHNRNYLVCLRYYVPVNKTYVGIRIGSSDFPRTLYINGTAFSYYGADTDDSGQTIALLTYSGVALNLIYSVNSQLNLTFSPAPTGYL
jgi:hypothetical protein